MGDQWFMKIFLAPLAMLYGLAVSLKNGLYNLGLLRGVSFSIPVISIGNLTVGGTGKTPHTEYLVLLLQDYLQVGILSRGYKRKTSGYLEVHQHMDALQCGDEPLQYKRKFPDVKVAVAENRSLAIPQLIRSYPDLQVVLLDDGFQHREVAPGLNILLTEYNHLFTSDWLLPVGRLREWRSGAERADVIIVTKCPGEVNEEDMDRVRQEVIFDPRQMVFFSKYIYGHPYRMYQNNERIVLNEHSSVLVVAAIARTGYMIDYLKNVCREVHSLEYSDHHIFSEADIRSMEQMYINFPESNRPVLLTTEKDALRLDLHRDLLLQSNLPFYVLPIRVQFLGEQPDAFDQYIKDWLLKFRR